MEHTFTVSEDIEQKGIAAKNNTTAGIEPVMSAWPIDHGAPKRQDRGSILGRKANLRYTDLPYILLLTLSL